LKGLDSQVSHETSATHRDGGSPDEMGLPLLSHSPSSLRLLKPNKIVSYTNAAHGANDYYLSLTDRRPRPRPDLFRECAYVGKRPSVPVFAEYAIRSPRQTTQAEQPRKPISRRAFGRPPDLRRICFSDPGPAINSGPRACSPLGYPGQTARQALPSRITRFALARPSEFPAHHAGTASSHQALSTPAQPTSRSPTVAGGGGGGGICGATIRNDRWVEIRRPTRSPAAELTMKTWELLLWIRRTKTAEAPLQMKSTNGTFLIDDFPAFSANAADRAPEPLGSYSTGKAL